MGIKGLTSFLDCHSTFLTDFKLRDTRVIIDGNNLFHFLNALYGVDDNFGGNYDCFALATHSFFGTLRKCNVTPLVLFDGPYIPSEKKIGTSVKRARERIQFANEMSLGSSAQRITPILCQDVFISCLNKIGVQHLTCENEADDDIAVLANEYNCPVMTNDSDFFIFNIRAGVILLDYVNLKIRYATEQLSPNQSERYIKVQIYYSHKLMNAYNLDVDKLALFGTVLGNDRVDNKLFVTFFAMTRLPGSANGRGYLRCKRKKIDRVLQWLQTAGTVDEAISKILSRYPSDRAGELREVIEDSVNSYRSVNTVYITISDGLLKHVESRMTTIAGHPLPPWLVDELHKGQISTLVTNTLTCRKVILLAQPENFKLNSAHDCSMLLRHFIYGILLQYDAKFHDFHKSENLQCSETCAAIGKNSSVCEMDRDGRTQKSTMIEPLLVLDDKAIPSLHEIENLTHEERLNWLYLACGLRLDSSVVCRSPKGLELFLLCLSYWISHANPKVDVLHLTAVIVCLLKLGALDPLSCQRQTKCIDPQPEDNNTTTTVDPEPVADKLSAGTLRELIEQSCSHEEIIAAKQSLDAFKQDNMTLKKKGFAVASDINILHVFAQLQSCMQAIQALNEVLGSPLSRISVSHVFSGLFLFFFYREIRARKQYDGYVFQMLKQCKAMHEVVLAIRQIVTDSVDETAVLAETPHMVRCSAKKKRKQKIQNNAEVHQEASEGEQNSSEDEALEFQKQFIPECDINNRFGCLQIES